jgi:hypothetical protein
VLYSIYKLHQKIKTLKAVVKSVLIRQLFRKKRLYHCIVVNMQGGSVHTIKENTEALVAARRLE